VTGIEADSEGITVQIENDNFAQSDAVLDDNLMSLGIAGCPGYLDGDSVTDIEICVPVAHAVSLLFQGFGFISKSDLAKNSNHYFLR
jgi:hypothetical protein